MSILSDNLRFLRSKQKISQQAVSDQLLIARNRYATYEDGRSEPPIEILIRISKFFHISIDLLVSVDIRKYPVEDMLRLPDNRIVLPIVVDKAGNNSIEIIPQKATMGYLSGYSDPEYIENLQQIELPFLTQGKYRAFPVEGDSMPPFRDGAYIVGKYIEKTENLIPEKTYLFVTLNDGITYKRFLKTTEKGICVSADNSFYEPYNIALENIVEIWQYACGISTEEFEANDPKNYNLKDMFLELRRDIKEIDKKINKI